MHQSGLGAAARPGTRTWPWIGLVLLAVLVANAPAIVGIVDVNPLDTYAGLTRARAPQLVPGASTIDINVAATSQALGHRAALDWLSGHVPWWNPYEGVGTPLAAGMQAAAFFPLTLLLAWSGGQLLERILLEVLAGTATFFLVRRLGVRDGAAASCGAAFALCGTFAWFQHAAVNPVPFLPAALLGVEVAREHKLGDWRVLLLPIVLALSIVAGFPETAFFDGALAVLWALVRAGGEPDWAARARVGGRLAVLGLGGVLVTAPLLLAFRSYLGEANVGAHRSMWHIHLPAADLLALVDPYLEGPLKAFVPSGQPARVEHLFITTSGYVLVSGLVLAVAGLVLSRRQLAIRLLLPVWVLVLSLRDFGVVALERAFAHVPYLREAAVFRSAVPSVELAVIVLAGLGIEAVLAAGEPASRARRFHLALIAALVAALLLGLAEGPASTVMRLVWSGRGYPANPHPYVVAAAAATAGALVALGVGGALRGRAAAVTVCGVLLAEALASFVYPELAGTRAPVVDRKPVSFLAAHLGSQRFYSLVSDPAVGPEYGGPIAPNYGSYFGLAEAGYLDIPVPEAYVAYVHDHLDAGAGAEFFGTAIGRHLAAPPALVELGAHVSAFESIGVRYLVTGAAVPLRSYVPSAERVYDDGLVGIWRLPRATPLFSVTSGACRLRVGSTDSVVASCRGRAVIQRAELALAGWSATVDGRPAALRPSHGGLFSSVVLGPGTSRVVWSYSPGELGLGEGLAVFGLLLLAGPLAAAAFGREATRRGRGRPRSRPGGAADAVSARAVRGAP